MSQAGRIQLYVLSSCSATVRAVCVVVGLLYLAPSPPCIVWSALTDQTRRHLRAAGQLHVKETSSREKKKILFIFGFARRNWPDLHTVHADSGRPIARALFAFRAVRVVRASMSRATAVGMVLRFVPSSLLTPLSLITHWCGSLFFPCKLAARAFRSHSGHRAPELTSSSVIVDLFFVRFSRSIAP